MFPSPPACRLFAVLAGLLIAGFAVATADVVLLHTGERLTGTVVRENALEVVLETPDHGLMTIPLSTVERVQKDEFQGPVMPEPEKPMSSLFESRIPVLESAPHPDLIPLAPRPSLPEGTNSIFRTYWDGHVRYQLSTRLVLADPFHAGSVWVNNRLRLRGRIGMKLALDAADFVITEGRVDAPGGVQLRTFRVFTEGEYGVYRTNQFKVELGLVGGSFFLSKAYWRILDLPHFGDLTVGYLTAPQTLGNIMSYGSLTFMEQSAGTAAFSPGSRSGFAWNTTYFNERMTATAGLFSLGQNPAIDLGNASEALAQPVIRLTGLPWAEKNHWMHLGISGAFVFSDDGDIQYQARPESRLAPILVNTGSIDARTAVIVGLEWIEALGPVLLQAEYVDSAVFRDSENIRFHGGYFEGGWMLTGESRPYNRVTGAPTRVQPRHPLWGPGSGWGAWEAAGRLSMIDLSDGSVQGGRMRIVMGGLNWYWNQYIRWQLNAGYAIVTGGPTPGNMLIFEGRFESQF